MTYVGFDKATGFSADVAISDDFAGADNNDTSVNPSGGALAVLPTRFAPELSVPGLKFWLGEDEASNIGASVSTIRRLGLITGGTLVFIDRLDEPLALDSVHLFQAQLGLRLVNRQQPRFRFNT